ncbi:MAG: T9SS type A sorting domain-containing protein [Saprospiraceae bacterium]|nr:T9SS type A sorting domain-containing protein [Saprospiraceae bacterium]
MKRFLLPSLLAILSFTMLSAQNGSDEPCDGTMLTVFSSCETVVKSAGSMNTPTFTNSTSASAGVTLPSLSCNGFSSATVDFWYRCVVPASGSVTILVDLGTVSATYTSAWDMAIYTSSSGTCSGSTFTEIASECVTSTTALSAFPYFQLTGQTPGATLYIRMWRTASLAQNANRSFAIWAIEGSITPPVSCPTIVRPTNGATLNEDPVFEWNSDPNATAFDFIFGSDANSLYIFRDIEATTPPQLTELFGLPHSRIGSSPFTYVAPGVTNYWYVQQKNCASNPNAACPTLSYSAAPVPANDDCANAIALTVPDVYQTYTSASSSQSMAPSTCSSATSDNASDVWFKFTTTTAGDVAIGMKTNVNMDAVLEVFNGACGSLVTRTCADDAGEDDEEVIILNSLPANTTYYVRVYNYIKSSSGSPSTLLYGYQFQMIISGNIGVIPVELVSFTGEAKETKNVLNWQTASEQNADVYIVERSVDGVKNFMPIGKVKAAGNSAEKHEYQFYDDNPQAVAYYRLKQVDFDGKENLSKHISLVRTNKKLALVNTFPSPVSDDLNVVFNSSKDGQVTLHVVDILGRTVSQQTVSAYSGQNSANLKLGNLAPGSYYVVLSDGLSKTQLPIIKN